MTPFKGRETFSGTTEPASYLGGGVYPGPIGDASRITDSGAGHAHANNGKLFAHIGETRLAWRARPEYVRARLGHVAGARFRQGISGNDFLEGRLTEVCMSQLAGADVIVVADREPTAVETCLRNILTHGGPHLRRLIVVDNDSVDPEVPAMLERLASFDSRLLIVRNSPRLERVGSYNRGLEERQGDAVLLSSDCVVAPHWLTSLFDAAHSEERAACGPADERPWYMLCTGYG